MNAEEVVQSVLLPAVADELSALGSTVIVDGVLESAFVQTIRDIVAQTISRVLVADDDNAESVSVRYAVTAEFTDIAVANGEAQRHPAEPLMAAEVLFGVALPVLAQHLGSEVDPIRLARILHNEIWRRFPPGAIAYVEFILSKLARAHREERLVISRELHDRVAHRLALALQRAELARQYPDQAELHLDVAEAELRASLLDVQDLAVALRPIVDNRGIEEAARDLVERLPAEPRIGITSSGHIRRLLDSVSEELFAIVVEAVRNARRHAEATSIDVSFQWAGADLLIEISDDGVGFDPALTKASGLNSMSQRAQVVGATLKVSRQEKGTTVRVDVPLARVSMVES